MAGSKWIRFGGMCVAVLGLTVLDSVTGLAQEEGYTFESVAISGATFTGVAAITPDRRVVGYFRNASGFHGFVLVDGEMTELNVPVPGARGTIPFGMNGAGDVVGFFFDAQLAQHGFLWPAHGDFTVIDGPGAFRTNAHGINAAGDVVGHYDVSTGDRRRGFLRDRSGTITTIDLDNATGVAPNGTWGNWINNRGDIVGTFFDGSIHGYLLSSGTTTQLDVPFPGVTETQAWGMNSQGDIVGQYTAGGRTMPFKRDRHGNYESLDIPELAAAPVVSAFSINPSGDIVGQYTAGGVTRGFVLYRTTQTP